MFRKNSKILFLVLFGFLLYPQVVLADIENWDWVELRLPVVKENSLNIPKTNFRFFILTDEKNTLSSSILSLPFK